MTQRNIGHQTQRQRKMLMLCLAAVAVLLPGIAWGDGVAEKTQPAVTVDVLRSDPIPHRVDDTVTSASLVRVTFAPGAASPPHHHPGPVSGYVIEGTLEFQVAGQPLRVLHAGDTFFEPAMILHQVARNPDPKNPCRVLVTMIHPANAKRLTIPASEVASQPLLQSSVGAKAGTTNDDNE